MSEKDKKAIRLCIQQEILTYLVTGRPYCFARYIAQVIAPEVKVISVNGGIYEIGNRVYQQCISKDAIFKIIGYMKDCTVPAFVKSIQVFYTHEAYDKRFLYDHMDPTFSSNMQVHPHTNISWKQRFLQAHDIVKRLVYDQ